MSQHIILKSLDKPREKDLNKDITWVCDSFGFQEGRDLQQVTVRLVDDMLKRLSREGGVASETIAEDLDISTARVNYHIRNLMDAGFVHRQRRLIFLRAGSLQSTVEEMRKDANRIFDELSVMARHIDAALGIKNRE